uniref:AlNc14C106G6212 protein n=1 Tax=Albugo laibachii Nc14 TaxID=890382 RepID=F0WI05_9STRA|nr:AlNc14C106G6212 [Albugo laibachii Nc14]|eukprot:CCA20882.1 AlNc14C106G6212 [Albugo laibachii Nc14]
MLLLRLVYNLIEINLQLEEQLNAKSGAKEQCEAKKLVSGKQEDDLLAGNTLAAAL